jgi:hypothetical protein
MLIMWASYFAAWQHHRQAKGAASLPSLAATPAMLAWQQASKSST